MSSRRYLLLLSGAAATLVLLAAVGAWGLWSGNHPLTVWAMLAASLPFAASCWFSLRWERALDRRTANRALLVILATAGAMRLLFLAPEPLSTDIYRYIWDGRVQAAGINPYRYVPADPALGFLRDEAIYPHINRADFAPTIYPPTAQLLFAAVTRLSQSVAAMKIAMLALEAVAIASIVLLLRHRGLPLTRVLFYAWHPLPVLEFAGSGHVDAAAIAFMLLACLTAQMRRPGLTGLALALATLVKFFPLAIAPALYRRWDWRAPAVGLAVVTLLYALYSSVGLGVLGYLSGYTHEEELATGEGFFLLSALARGAALPARATELYLLAGMAILAGLGLVTGAASRPCRFRPGGGPAAAGHLHIRPVAALPLVLHLGGAVPVLPAVVGSSLRDSIRTPPERLSGAAWAAGERGPHLPACHRNPRPRVPGELPGSPFGESPLCQRC